MPEIVERKHFGNRRIVSVKVNDKVVEVTVTSTPAVVRKWISYTLYLYSPHRFANRLVAGLGVQWTPSNDADPPADTLQLCVGHRCLLFQLSYAARVPLSLRNFLGNPSITFVGFWNHSDKRKLESCDHRLLMHDHPLDLRQIALTDEGKSLRRAPVDEIIEECLGIHVDQSVEVSMSDWDNDFLSDEQIVYACVDAHCAFVIGKEIGAWTFR